MEKLSQKIFKTNKFVLTAGQNIWRTVCAGEQFVSVGFCDLSQRLGKLAEKSCYHGAIPVRLIIFTFVVKYSKKTFIQQNTENTTQEQFINYIYAILYQATNGLLKSIC